MGTPNDKKNKGPVAKFKVGPVSLDLWENEVTMKNGQKGTFLTGSLQRGYKDKDGNWQNTNTLRKTDFALAILALMKGMDYAYQKHDDKEEE